MSCKACQFAYSRGDDLECHFYPPSEIMGAIGWPIVGTDEYCGQWLHRLASMPNPQKAADRPAPRDAGGRRQDVPDGTTGDTASGDRRGFIP